MRTIVLYHPNTRFGGEVEDYAAEFERYKHKKLELISLETVEGSDLAKLYDIADYPAILVRSDDGSLLHDWQGVPLPLMDELSYYIQNEPSLVSGSGRTILPAHH